MKTIATSLILLGFTGVPVFAQLTPDQKVFEFQALASVYVRHYAPYEWKRDTLKFDLFDLKPWLDRVRATRDDLSFYDLCAQYVARLDDAHSTFVLPSNFTANLGFAADIYDGKVVIDGISRGLLPASRYPFQIGDELVSIDGKPVAELLQYISQYTSGANPRSTARVAAGRLATRSQWWLPRAHEIGDQAVVEVKRRTTGDVETYRIQWQKFGIPLVNVGPVPSPRKTSDQRAAVSTDEYLDKDPLPLDILNYGSLQPVWRFPDGFQQRLGRIPADFFISGSYTAEDKRIGVIRIPNFAPANTTNALRQFETEITWMQENTDGLIIDVMRNNGGSACYNEEIQRRLIPYNFQGIGREIRATRSWVNQFSSELEAAIQARAEPHVITLMTLRLNDITTAYSEPRGRTGTLSICAEQLTRVPAAVVYRKPLMVLIDEFSTSAADAFPAVIQDAKRGPLFGMRTRGAGGTIGNFRYGVFGEATTSATVAMHHRDGRDIPYVENVGVQPDIEYDYMTIDNLLSGGRAFVTAFTNAMLAHIRR